ncbi:MAG: hypothetical protein A3205_09225 [Methanomassiliicoccales archaeon Mx-03]|nr:MAG: hypothetical protein A3205_09225 [Methanomassiliicoccales archaeon Mx-03]
MADELTVCAAAYFRSIGKDVTTPEEFVMGTSLELKWMSPSDSKLLLSAMIRAGVVTQKDGYVRPASDLGAIDLPLAYRPPKELVESLHGSKSQTTEKAPAQKKQADTADVFPMLMERAVEEGMQRRDFIQSCNRIQKRLDIEIGVAALIVLRDAGADVSPYLDAVYDSVKGS